MDDRIGKHSTKGLRTDAQRTTTNIYVGGVKKLLLSNIFFFLPPKNEEDRSKHLILSSPSLWPDLITIKRRRDMRKLFHSDNTICALMSLFGNKSL